MTNRFERLLERLTNTAGDYATQLAILIAYYGELTLGNFKTVLNRVSKYLGWDKQDNSILLGEYFCQNWRTMSVKQIKGLLANIFPTIDNVWAWETLFVDFVKSGIFDSDAESSKNATKKNVLIEEILEPLSTFTDELLYAVYDAFDNSVYHNFVCSIFEFMISNDSGINYYSDLLFNQDFVRALNEAGHSKNHKEFLFELVEKRGLEFFAEEIFGYLPLSYKNEWLREYAKTCNMEEAMRLFDLHWIKILELKQSAGIEITEEMFLEMVKVKPADTIRDELLNCDRYDYGTDRICTRLEYLIDNTYTG